MELNGSSLLRIVVALILLWALSVLLRKYEQKEERGFSSWHAWAAGAFALLALSLIPFWSPPYLGTAESSVLGVWVLLQLSLFALNFDAASPSHPAAYWTVAWGISLAVGTTLFSTTDLSILGAQQDRTLGGLVPGWGGFLQPLAAAIALVSQAGMARADAGRTLNPRTPRGCIQGAMIAATVVVFLGAWNLPWMSASDLNRAVGSESVRCLLQVAIFGGKMATVWLAILKISHWKPLWDRDLFSSYRLAALSSGNLAITWAVVIGGAF